MNAQTADKIYRRKPVDEITLRHVFEKLKITPPFTKERYCVLAPPSPSGNLPPKPVCCIGRETEIAEIQTLLESSDLVTLTGPGGVGKTLLAIQVGQEIKCRFAAGVWLVELAGVADPGVVIQKVATTLGVPEEKGHPLLQTLTHFLHGKPLLLILDNCEHLLEACASLMHHLLSASACLKVLATSRESLNITAELAYPVPPLCVPEWKPLPDKQGNVVQSMQDYAAVRLFVERVKAHRPDFTVTDQNARMLAAICRRLDGLPLAIELAAARMRAMDIEDLEQRLHACFRLLTGGSKTAPPRHQTLQATIDWSYDLLTAQEKALLRRLSVFAEGGSREAAEQVCAGDGIEAEEVLDILTSLVDKSLVVYRKPEGKRRYHLLETVRQYGQEQLEKSEESEGVHRRHRDYFLAWSEEIEPKLKEAEKAEWLQRLEAEHENLRAALDYSLSEAGSSAGLRLCEALLKFWGGSWHFSEGLDSCARMLAKADAQESSPERAKVLNGAGILSLYLGDCPSAITYHQESLAIYAANGDRHGMAGSLNHLGSVTEAQGGYVSALSYFQESLAIYKEFGDRIRMANLLKNLGSVAYFQGDYEAARSALEESLELSREAGNRMGMADALAFLGNVAYAQGDNQAARVCHEQSLSLCREIGYPDGIAYALCSLGRLLCKEGDYAAARTALQESLILAQEVGNQTGLYPLEGRSCYHEKYRASLSKQPCRTI